MQLGVIGSAPASEREVRFESSAATRIRVDLLFQTGSEKPVVNGAYDEYSDEYFPCARTRGFY